MKFSRKKEGWLLGALAVLTLSIIFVVRFQNVINWKLDIAQTYLRGLINPAEALPTALPTEIALESTSSLPTTATATATQTAQAIASLPTATLPVPTATLTPTPLPEQVVLSAPAYEGQDWNNCGPAALAMQLRFFGWQGDQYTISDLVKPMRDDRNVNVEELVYYVRNYAGWLQAEYRVGGNVDLLRNLLAAGIPVVVEETFRFEEAYWLNDDLWAGHYLLLTGYDDAKQTFITQNTFIGPNLEKTYQELDEGWQAFNRVYVLVYPPEQEAAVKSILGQDWDANTNRQNALAVSRQETEETPQNAFAWFNLGSNLVYFEEYGEAVQAYDTARQLGLPQRMLRYQFGPFLAYFHAGRTEDLLTLADYALERTPNAEEAMLWRGWALYRLGRNAEAAASFRSALEVRPDYLDAQYALDFLQGE